METMENIGRGFGAREWGRHAHRDRKCREAGVRIEAEGSAKVIARIESVVRWIGAREDTQKWRNGRLDAHGHERAGIEAYKNAPKWSADIRTRVYNALCLNQQEWIQQLPRRIPTVTRHNVANILWGKSRHGRLEL
jgi:hypothetical protein